MRTTKKTSKAGMKKAAKDLQVKPANGGTVRGGCGTGMSKFSQSVSGAQWIKI